MLGLSDSKMGRMSYIKFIFLKSITHENQKKVHVIEYCLKPGAKSWHSWCHSAWCWSSTWPSSGRSGGGEFRQRPLGTRMRRAGQKPARALQYACWLWRPRRLSATRSPSWCAGCACLAATHSRYTSLLLLSFSTFFLTLVAFYKECFSLCACFNMLTIFTANKNKLS